MPNLTVNEWVWSPTLAICKECKGLVMPKVLCSSARLPRVVYHLFARLSWIG